MGDEPTNDVLSCLGDLRNYPTESLAPYEEFVLGAKTYYFAPGGSLYRKDEPELDEGAEVEISSDQNFEQHAPAGTFPRKSSRDAPILSDRLLELPEGVILAGVWFLGAALIGLGVLAFYLLAQVLAVATSAV